MKIMKEKTVFCLGILTALLLCMCSGCGSRNDADDTWYMTGDIYTDENGHRLEVLYDDEGMLQFAVDGLSLYNTMADRFQTENNWRIYTCDDGTTVVYYPGAPAHLEIPDGEYAGVYEADNSE